MVESKYPEMLTENNPELIVVAGGDGSIIRAIHKYMHLNVPFFGIGYGTLNFVMNEVEDITELFESNFNFTPYNNYGVKKTKTIEIDVVKKDGKIISTQAINEIVIGGTVMGYHTLTLNSDDKVFEEKTIKSEFVAISSPLGSTAYHFNNNGNVIPDLHYPLIGVSTGVGSPSEKINMLIEEQELVIDLSFTRDHCYVFVDGIIKDQSLEIGDKVVMRPGKSFEIVFLDEKAFQIKRLNAKR
jgi:hypothetical protein